MPELKARTEKVTAEQIRTERIRLKQLDQEISKQIKRLQQEKGVVKYQMEELAAQPVSYMRQQNRMIAHQKQVDKTTADWAKKYNFKNIVKQAKVECLI